MPSSLAVRSSTPPGAPWAPGAPGAKASVVTGREWAGSRPRRLPVKVSRSSTVPSDAPAASTAPVPSKAAAVMRPDCPDVGSPVALPSGSVHTWTSASGTVAASWTAVASRRPSGL